MIEVVGAGIHSKSPDVRLLRFVYPVCVFNAWVMANAALAGVMKTGAGKPLITQQHFKDALVWEESSNRRVPPEPPPPALPQDTSGKTDTVFPNVPRADINRNITIRMSRGSL